MENNKKIILVNPWIHDFAAHDLWLKPLGLLYIADSLENQGYQVSIIDCLNYNNTPRPYGCGKFHSEEITKPCHFQNIPRKYKRYGMPPEIFARLLMEINNAAPDEPPLFIGVTSAMTYWHQGVAETIRYIKQVFTETPVVLGGIYTTLCHKHALKNAGADYVVQGPGETAILNLARQLDGSTPTPAKTGAKRIYPAYHLYNWPKQPTRSVAMLTSRGCPFRCSYCASASLTPDFFQRPPHDVADEISYYQKELGVTDIAFYDDALLVNAANHIHPILDEIIRRGLNRQIRFHTPNGLHIKYLDKTLAQKLYQSNFKTIRLGFEGLNEHKASPEQLAEVIINLKQAGFGAEHIGVYVLMGLPDQPLDKITRAIKFVHKCGAQIRIAQYSPAPGSPDFAKLLPLYPELAKEPLLHNKSVYYCHNNGRQFSDFEAVKTKVRALNNALPKKT
jgi:radical SAM superfamily enzyme YgiQ (UPF0313 family)